MNEMRSRVRRITYELNVLLEQLAELREEDAKELTEEVLTPETIKGFKSSVDAMRRVLWFYAETRQSSPAERSLKLQSAVDALRSLRQDGCSSGAQGADGSFIEKVEAIVDKKMPSLHEN